MPTTSDAPRFNPVALSIARAYRKLTVSELASEAAISRQFVSALENGAMPPFAPALSALAATLRFPVGFFFQPLERPDRSVFHFRTRARVSQRTLEQAQAHAALFSLVADTFYEYARFAPSRFPSIACDSDFDRVEAAAEAFRTGLGFSLDAPIVNSVRVAEAAGAFVGTCRVGEMPVEGFCWSSRAPMIVLRDGASWSRRRFSVMHEGGHIVLHQAKSPSKSAEAEANRFAGAALVPRAAFWREFPRPNRRFDWAAMIAMKQRWGISLQAMVHRAFDLGLIDAAKYRIANIHIARFGWRTEEPGESAPEQPEVWGRFLKALRSRRNVSVSDLCDRANVYVATLEQMLQFNLEEKGQGKGLRIVQPNPPT